MMNEEQRRQSRITYLRRQQDRRHYLNDFLLSISRIAERPILATAVLSLEETHALAHKLYFRDSQNPVYSVTFPFSQAEKLRKIISSLKPEVTDPKTYFATGRFYKSFFLQLDSAFALENFEEIIELDTNTFYLYHKDLTNGLMLDSNEENWTERGKTQYIWTYGLRVWGKDWVEKIHKAYHKHA
ncbi:hypothetical protein [Rufibacter psychrotolerans]|uniref:hypothetical protein n=1 Tax=Rufibacter psychrotolerans TaxID=2812556 RepID=UPI001967EEA7|nr:hypothetical protein [Rufibacter sp. SYSU D00308]